VRGFATGGSADKPVRCCAWSDNRKTWRAISRASVYRNPYTETDADAWFAAAREQAAATAWAIDVGGQAVGGIGI
jgi:hypothetical protein